MTHWLCVSVFKAKSTGISFLISIVDAHCRCAQVMIHALKKPSRYYIKMNIIKEKIRWQGLLFIIDLFLK
jgi:hypothetical protein